MIFDPQMGGSDQYPKIPVILTVVVLQCDLLAVFRPCGEDKGADKVRSPGAGASNRGRRCRRRRRVSLSRSLAREPLVVVRVRRQHTACGHTPVNADTRSRSLSIIGLPE
jgi:hypothetical protein